MGCNDAAGKPSTARGLQTQHEWQRLVHNGLTMMAAGHGTAGLGAGGARPFSRLLLFLGAAGLAGAQLAADFPQAGAPGRQRFLTGIDVVSVDVSVLDRGRQPVRDLRASDFTVLENGKPQQIEYFQHIQLPDPPPMAASWVKDVAADVARNDMLRERRLVVLLMDDAMMPFDGQMVASAKQVGRDVVDRLGPGDLAAVVFTRDNRGAQNFTSDKARLLAAIDTFEASGYSPPGLGDLPVQSAQVLYRLSEGLARVPDRRKAVVHVSIGIPLEIDTHEAPGDTSYLTWLAKRTMGIAQRGNVNIYTADPGGLDGVRFYMLRGNRRTESFVIERIEDSANRFRDFLKAIADQTGGHAFINTNEFTSRIEQMFRETGSFYLLGYRPQDQRADGRFRRLQVRVNRRGVTVRARSGDYAPPSKDSRMTLPEFPVDDALAALVPRTELPLELSAAAFAVPGQPEAAVVLTLGAHAPRNQTAPSAAGERVDVLFGAFTPEADPRGSLRLTLDLTVAADRDGARAYEVLGRLDLRPGRYELRASAASKAASGSVYTYLEVPEFTRDPLSLSDVAIGTTPARIAGNGEAAAGVLPFLPTTRRVFDAAAHVTSFFRVHQGGSAAPGPVALTLRVIDTADQTVVDERQTMEAAAFGPARSAEVRWTVSRARLAPGSYLYAVEASDGTHVAKRAVRFEVR